MKPIRFLPKIQRGEKCLNCDLPLSEEDNFCPNCGQRNDTRSLNFGNFLNAIFSELISYDSRLWRTIFSMLIHPGQVSREYIDGKRFRYANPFRFYLTISLVFFVLIGFVNKYEDLKGAGKTKNVININPNAVNKKKDSILKETQKKLDLLKNIDPNDKDLKKIDKNVIQPLLKADNSAISLDTLYFGNNNSLIAKKLTRYNRFYKTHKNLSTEQALDSLQEPKIFWNRFYYSKIKSIYSIVKDKGNSLIKKIMSNLSIALFIFLPFFTLFLKLLYVRRRLNYMEHLVFVFNTQTVFFLFMIILLILTLITESAAAPGIFVLMFLGYLYLAMLKFYKQGWFKTFVKFCILNIIYLNLSGIGLTIVSILAVLID